MGVISVLGFCFEARVYGVILVGGGERLVSIGLLYKVGDTVFGSYLNVGFF